MLLTFQALCSDTGHPLGTLKSPRGGASGSWETSLHLSGAQAWEAAVPVRGEHVQTWTERVHDRPASRPAETQGTPAGHCSTSAPRRRAPRPAPARPLLPRCHVKSSWLPRCQSANSVSVWKKICLRRRWLETYLLTPSFPLRMATWATRLPARALSRRRPARDLGRVHGPVLKSCA